MTWTVPRALEATTLPLFGTNVMIVRLAHAAIADEAQCQLLIATLRARYPHCTTVLVARDGARPATYYGPLDILRALVALPFEAYTFRTCWLPPPVTPVQPPPIPAAVRGFDTRETKRVTRTL